MRQLIRVYCVVFLSPSKHTAMLRQIRSGPLPYTSLPALNSSAVWFELHGPSLLKERRTRAAVLITCRLSCVQGC